MESQKIPYMLSGSLAMITYTVPRMTRDIDIVINLKQENLSDFISIFNEKYYLSIETIKEEIDRKGMFNVVDWNSGFKIDFIILKNSEFHLNEFERRKKNFNFGFPIWIVSREDLVIAKLKWIQDIQSDTQLLDIKNLLDTDEIDFTYIKNWTRKLKLQTFKLFKI